MKKAISNLILIICVIVFLFCGYQLIRYFLQYKQATDEYKDVVEQVVTSKKNKKGKKERVIDWNKLMELNSDTIGWISAKGTDIDYPIVLGKDNDEYLHKTFQGTTNSSGAIFMDAAGKKDFSSPHNIIYGHHMRNGSMFADLLEFREQKFIKKHDKIIIETPEKKITLQVISAYARSAQYKIPVSFGDDFTMDDYKEDILSRSEIQSNVKKKDINRAKQIYTFVTCSYETEDNRTFVHAIEVDTE